MVAVALPLLFGLVKGVVVRVKKDKDSWNAGGIITRDKRNDKSFDGPSAPARKKKNKKNKKKWCKGVEGRKHQLVYRECIKYASMSWYIEGNIMEVVCEKCGKHFQTDWGARGRPKKGREKLLTEWSKKLGIELVE